MIIRFFYLTLAITASAMLLGPISFTHAILKQNIGLLTVELVMFIKEIQ